MAISFNTQNCPSNKTISSVYIDDDGNLVVVYSDTTSEILGKVVGSNGKNFTPDQVGTLVPDGTMFIAEPQGFVYESLANNNSLLYFKSSLANVTPSTFCIVQYGKGDKGDPFGIDASGATLPASTGLAVGYTFYLTTTGVIYIINPSLQWSGPFQFKGDTGAQGQFIINASGTTLPTASTLYNGYTFFNTTDGKLYYIYTNNSVLTWSPGTVFQGPQGIQGPIGLTGADAEYIISNTVDFSMANTLLVLGTCPAGYVVTNADVNVTTQLQANVVEMEIRFGGTSQSVTGSIVIYDQDDFDINVQRRYLVNEINHDPSETDQIVSAVFDYAPLNSDTGIIVIKLTLGKQLPTQPIVI